MDIHAYPTESSTPVDRTEAARIAERYLSGADHAERGITHLLTEFDAGFTVVAVFPPAPNAGPNPPPIIVGGSVCVIDKATGAVSFWPTYPIDLVAEQYTDAVSSGRLVVEDSWPEPE